MGQTYVTICRSVSDGLTPGSIPGFHCANCGKEVQLTREGQQQLAHVGREQMLILCNPCGFRLIHERVKLAKRHPEAETVMQFNPEATDQLQRMTGECALDTFPTAKVSFDPMDLFRDPKK